MVSSIYEDSLSLFPLEGALTSIMRTCSLGFLRNSKSHPCSGFGTLADMILFSTQLVLWVSSWMSSVFLHTLGPKTTVLCQIFVQLSNNLLHF